MLTTGEQEAETMDTSAITTTAETAPSQLFIYPRPALDMCGDIVLCMIQLNLSARTYHRTRSVKLARTIADLGGSAEIRSVHLAEALHLQPSEVDAGVIQANRKIFSLLE